jgi:hypothetical protein
LSQDKEALEARKRRFATKDSSSNKDDTTKKQKTESDSKELKQEDTSTKSS